MAARTRTQPLKHREDGADCVKSTPMEPFRLPPLPPNPYVNHSSAPLFLFFGSSPAASAGAADLALRYASAAVCAVLLPLKVVCVVACVLLAWALSALSILGTDTGRKRRVGGARDDVPSQPLARWRHTMQVATVKPLCRIALFLMGFLRIEVKGTLAKRERCPIVVANHTGFLDIFLMHVMLDIPVGVSAAENINFPIMGYIMVSRNMSITFVCMRRKAQMRTVLLTRIPRTHTHTRTHPCRWPSRRSSWTGRAGSQARASALLRASRGVPKTTDTRGCRCILR